MNKIFLSTLFTINIALSYAQWTQVNQDIYGEAQGYYLGFTVSSNASGNVIAVGGHHDDGISSNPENTGRVRILENIGGTWSQIGQNIDDGVSVWSNQEPGSISLNANGNIIAIGTPLSNSIPSGFVRIYENIAGTWTQIESDIIGDASQDLFGYVVSLNNDGDIVAIGAPRSDLGGVDSGLVRIFKNVAGTWTQIGQDIYGNSYGVRLGHSLSLSSSGNIVAIGAPIDGSDNKGHVRVFQNISGTWTQIGQDIIGEFGGDQSGSSTSLSADGTIVAIGSIFNTPNSTIFGAGHVRVFKNIAGTWTQIGQDIDGEFSDDQSGRSISLNANGDTIAIGAPQNASNNTGHVRIYKNIGNTWVKIGEDIDGENPWDLVGLAVSLNDNGSKVIIGEPYNDVNGSQSGRTRIFENTNVLSIETYNLDEFEVYPNPATTNLSIKSKLDFESITIYDINGRQLKSIPLKSSSSKYLLDVRDLSNGMYFMELQSGKSKQVKKIIKK